MVSLLANRIHTAFAGNEIFGCIFWVYCNYIKEPNEYIIGQMAFSAGPPIQVDKSLAAIYSIN